MNKYIPIAPLPQIKQLLHSFISQQSLRTAWCGPGQKAIFVPRASQGLTETVKVLLRNKKGGIIFLPDYFCNEVLIPLKQLPIKLVFYPITEKLNPDWDLLDEIVKRYGKPDIFILVHYFGFPNDLKKTLNFCERKNTFLIEDAAHVFLPFGDIGKYSLATIYSLYKILPISILGLVVTNKKLNITTYKKNFDSDSLIWLVKRLIQSFVVKSHLPIRKKMKVNFSENIISPFKTKSSVSRIALSLLNAIEKEFEQIKIIRRRNYKIIERTIRMKDNVIEPLFPTLPRDVCPYLFPIKIKKNIKKIYCQLNKNGIPAQPWPNLPTEVLANPSKHKTAIQLRNSLLTIPINQSLGERELNYITQKLRFSIK